MNVSGSTGSPAQSANQPATCHALNSSSPSPMGPVIPRRHTRQDVSRATPRAISAGLSKRVFKPSSQPPGAAPSRLMQPPRPRIHREGHRSADPGSDGTANCSLVTLGRALRRPPYGLPRVSTYTMRPVLHEASVEQTVASCFKRVRCMREAFTPRATITQQWRQA
jgi:hypothetical protein